jgi:hypothetical protein
MSKLIVFFSLSGNNREIAKERAEKENCQIIEFSPGGYLRVFQFFFKRGLKRKAKKIDAGNYDELIIYGPIWAGKPAPAIMALLKNLDLEGKSVECQFSHTGNLGETEEITNEIIKERNGTINNISFYQINEKGK